VAPGRWKFDSPPLLVAASQFHATCEGLAAAELRGALAHTTDPVGDRFCTDIGRDPSAITRSMFLPVSWDRPEMTRAAVTEALDAGFPHIVLGLPAPYVDGVVQRVAAEIIGAHAATG